MKNIKNLFSEQLSWKKEETSNDIFVSKKYSKKECYLKMNDFPDEPMWTLFYRDESVDFDDAPSKWNIKY